LVTFAVTEYEPVAVTAGAVICNVTDVLAPGASGTELVEYTALHPVGADAVSANVEAEQAELSRFVIFTMMLAVAPGDTEPDGLVMVNAGFPRVHVSPLEIVTKAEADAA
jgi:hypothetical protein